MRVGGPDKGTGTPLRESRTAPPKRNHAQRSLGMKKAADSLRGARLLRLCTGPPSPNPRWDGRMIVQNRNLRHNPITSYT